MKLDQTLGTVRQLLSGLPNETPVYLLSIEDPKFVIIIDSAGNAQRVVSKVERSLVLHVSLPISS